MNKKKRISLMIILAVVVAAGSNLSWFLGDAYADDLGDRISTAAKAQTYAYILGNCLKNAPAKIQNTQDNLDKNAYLGSGKVKVSSELEAELNFAPKGGNGKIECNSAAMNNVMNEFAQMVGLSGKDELLDTLLVHTNTYTTKGGPEWLQVDTSAIAKLYDDTFALNPYTSWDEAQQSYETLAYNNNALNAFNSECAIPSNLEAKNVTLTSYNTSSGKVEKITVKVADTAYDDARAYWTEDTYGHNHTMAASYSFSEPPTSGRSCADLFAELQTISDKLEKEQAELDASRKQYNDDCKAKYNDKYDALKAARDAIDPVLGRPSANPSLGPVVEYIEKARASGNWLDSNGECPDYNVDGIDLSDLKTTDENFNEIVSGTLPGQGTAEGEVTPLDDCFNEADAMGWWACPFTFALGNALSEIYDGFIVPALTVDPELLNTENGAYIAWGYFRDFANLLFVILLLIVILSQVTGFGIDNYGIKKLLPKMIIAAILVNLSYIICQLAVDISNIIGTSMYGLFAETMAEGIHVSTGDMNGWLHGLVLALLGAMGGAAIRGAVILSGGWAVLLPLILSFVSAVIAVIFMFVLLAARQAGVLILVVISPLALVLYALPNTNSLAKKWFDTFKALLMIFPICGAVVGGGFLASKIIFYTNPGNFLTQLISMLVMIAPYFFIPSIIKSSIAQVNGLGAKLSGLGSRISGATTGFAGRAIRSSGAYQRSAERADIRKAEREAARGERYIARHGKDTNMSRRTRQRLGQAYAAVNKERREGLSMEREGRTYDSWDATQAGIQAGYEEEDIKNAMAMYTAGGAESGGIAVNPDSVESLQAAMENEGAAGHVANMMALKRMLESKGKAGYNAVGRAFDSEKLRGNATSMNKLAGSIAGDANYKNQSRSVHTAANNFINPAKPGDAPKVTSANAIRAGGGAISSMKSSEISQMTDDEFDAFIAQGQSGNADAVRMASEVLSDDNLRAQLSSREINRLQAISGGGEPVGPSGYTTSEQQEMFRQRSDQANEQYQRSQAQEGQDFKIDR